MGSKLLQDTSLAKASVYFRYSDCHAWGSSPNIELYRIVLRIDTDAPGFSKVKIEPHLGTLTNASGTVPHPNRNIKASYILQNGKWNIDITLPPTMTGRFIWKAKNIH